MTTASRTDQARSGAGLPSRPKTSASALVNSRIWARQTLKCIRSIPVETLSSAPSSDGPGKVRSRLALAAQNIGQRIGEFADMGEADVEMHPLDPGRDLVQRAELGRTRQGPEPACPRGPKHRPAHW